MSLAPCMNRASNGAHTPHPDLHWIHGYVGRAVHQSFIQFSGSPPAGGASPGWHATTRVNKMRCMEIQVP